MPQMPSLTDYNLFMSTIKGTSNTRLDVIVVLLLIIMATGLITVRSVIWRGRPTKLHLNSAIHSVLVY